METLPLGKILSMTALQKLSCKTLRKRGTPLFVMDMKSKRNAFVILDIKAYESLGLRSRASAAASDSRPAIRTKARGPLRVLDYRKMGLLWDRPGMTNDQFETALRNSRDANHPWAAKRLLEYAPSREVTKAFSLDQLKEMLGRVKLKPIYQEAWSHAIHYWSQNP